VRASALVAQALPEGLWFARLLSDPATPAPPPPTPLLLPVVEDAS
jgi:hypothetical protein